YLSLFCHKPAGGGRGGGGGGGVPAGAASDAADGADDVRARPAQGAGARCTCAAQVPLPRRRHRWYDSIFLFLFCLIDTFSPFVSVIPNSACIPAGCSDDAEETLRELERAVCLPLSVIFVGVGDADFSPLEKLCASRPAQKKNQP